MRYAFAALFLLAGLAGPAAAAEPPAPATRTDIEHVITAQIDAFRHDDGAKALSFAAPNIKARFGDGPHFLAVVRQAYAPVYRPRSFSFGAIEAESGHMVQHVELVAPDGGTTLALYDMEHEADGWRIAGCSLVAGERLSI